ncbi:LLLL and CFNLAS motif-containing protein 1 [Octodon degus]|uniref:LLLL and CFNLAS motif-containing protein 1 n=1 Tax=Octodon degus TaxID=10160 RepID=A0A6P3F2S7_OCTDE|nr:LLLL and CFNLAS motif-containing protein 1 [Octodon degus]
MTSLGSQPCRAAFLAATLLLLLWVKLVRSQQGSPGPVQRSLVEKTPPAEQGQEQYEEHFMASSLGERWQQDMTRSQEDFTSEKAAVQGHLFELTLCFNLASFMVFFMRDIEAEAVPWLLEEEDLIFYFCFLITS